MAIEAWFMDESHEDKRLPHHRDPKQFVSVDFLADLGVLYWKFNPKDYENDEQLQSLRETRGYNYMDLLDVCPKKLNNYEEKLKDFYTEHIHADEEIRYCLEGSGYFDVRDKDDHWIRIWIKPGDLIILPAGIYHRFTLDTDNYIKGCQQNNESMVDNKISVLIHFPEIELMRLFQGEPVWTPFNRPQEEHPARKGYLVTFTEKAGHAVESY